MSQAMPTLPTSRSANETLGDPALRRTVERFVRRRVPPSDVEDVVQTVFVDALATSDRPTEAAELTRWLLGIARHKVVDRHRRATREPPAELPEIPTNPPPIEARAFVRWAERQVGDKGDAQKTLTWMAREGEGEKLDAIAADEKVPAARVRQRVSRMRRWMKERWAAELAAVAVLATIVLAAWYLLHKDEPPVAHDQQGPAPTITPEPLDRARALRADALRACDRGEWQTCLDALDEARSLDPQGDRRSEVGAARENAQRALRERAQPTPTTGPSAATPAPSAPPNVESTAAPVSPPPAPSAKPSPTSFSDPPAEKKSAPVKPAPKSAAPEDFGKGVTPFGEKGGTGKPGDFKKKRASSKVLDSGGPWAAD
jgi:DNA-directed RNA polymerase specialized sigma24 family protein